MRRLTLVLFLLLPGVLLAQEKFVHLNKEQEIRDVEATQVAARTYVIHGPREVPNPDNQGFMNNPGFVITDDGVVVVDPGSSLYTGRMLLRQIRQRTDKPVTHVLNTHVHGDHWLGNQAFAEAFPKAIIMAHPNMVAEARAGAAEHWLRLMDNLTGGATKGTRAVFPGHTVDEGDSFQTGGMTFRILAPSRAHSGVDIMIHVVEESVLFAGDNLFYQRVGRMDDGTFRGNINACDVALQTGARVFVPGHGDSGDASRVTAFRTYLERLYTLVGKYYEQGLSDFAMKPHVVAAMQDYQHWDGFAEEIGKHVSLAMLEYEQAQFE
ncbi:MAG: MBL fold metallo-hydrolase [Gammaproteobacteria bacterium]